MNYQPSAGLLGTGQPPTSNIQYPTSSLDSPTIDGRRPTPGHWTTTWGCPYYRFLDCWTLGNHVGLPLPASRLLGSLTFLFLFCLLCLCPLAGNASLLWAQDSGGDQSPFFIPQRQAPPNQTQQIRNEGLQKPSQGTGTPGASNNGTAGQNNNNPNGNPNAQASNNNNNSTPFNPFKPISIPAPALPSPGVGNSAGGAAGGAPPTKLAAPPPSANSPSANNTKPPIDAQKIMDQINQLTQKMSSQQGKDQQDRPIDEKCKDVDNCFDAGKQCFAGYGKIVDIENKIKEANGDIYASDERTKALEDFVNLEKICESCGNLSTEAMSKLSSCTAGPGYNPNCAGTGLVPECPSGGQGQDWDTYINACLKPFTDENTGGSLKTIAGYLDLQGGSSGNKNTFSLYGDDPKLAFFPTGQKYMDFYKKLQQWVTSHPYEIFLPDEMVQECSQLYGAVQKEIGDFSTTLTGINDIDGMLNKLKTCTDTFSKAIGGSDLKDIVSGSDDEFKAACAAAQSRILASPCYQELQQIYNGLRHNFLTGQLWPEELRGTGMPKFSEITDCLQSVIAGSMAGYQANRIASGQGTKASTCPQLILYPGSVFQTQLDLTKISPMNTSLWDFNDACNQAAHSTSADQPTYCSTVKEIQKAVGGTGMTKSLDMDTNFDSDCGTTPPLTCIDSSKNPSALGVKYAECLLGPLNAVPPAQGSDPSNNVGFFYKDATVKFQPDVTSSPPPPATLPTDGFHATYYQEIPAMAMIARTIADFFKPGGSLAGKGQVNDLICSLEGLHTGNCAPQGQTSTSTPPPSSTQPTPGASVHVDTPAFVTTTEDLRLFNDLMFSVDDSQCVGSQPLHLIQPLHGLDSLTKAGETTPLGPYFENIEKLTAGAPASGAPTLAEAIISALKENPCLALKPRLYGTAPSTVTGISECPAGDIPLSCSDADAKAITTASACKDVTLCCKPDPHASPPIDPSTANLQVISGTVRCPAGSNTDTSLDPNGGGKEAKVLPGSDSNPFLNFMGPYALPFIACATPGEEKNSNCNPFRCTPADICKAYCKGESSADCKGANYGNPTSIGYRDCLKALEALKPGESYEVAGTGGTKVTNYTVTNDAVGNSIDTVCSTDNKLQAQIFSKTSVAARIYSLGVSANNAPDGKPKHTDLKADTQFAPSIWDVMPVYNNLLSMNGSVSGGSGTDALSTINVGLLLNRLLTAGGNNVGGVAGSFQSEFNMVLSMLVESQLDQAITLFKAEVDPAGAGANAGQGATGGKGIVDLFPSTATAQNGAFYDSSSNAIGNCKSTDENNIACLLNSFSIDKLKVPSGGSTDKTCSGATDQVACQQEQVQCFLNKIETPFVEPSGMSKDATPVFQPAKIGCAAAAQDFSADCTDLASPKNNFPCSAYMTACIGAVYAGLFAKGTPPDGVPNLSNVFQSEEFSNAFQAALPQAINRWFELIPLNFEIRRKFIDAAAGPSSKSTLPGALKTALGTVGGDANTLMGKYTTQLQNAYKTLLTLDCTNTTDLSNYVPMEMKGTTGTSKGVDDFAVDASDTTTLNGASSAFTANTVSKPSGDTTLVKLEPLLGVTINNNTTSKGIPGETGSSSNANSPPRSQSIAQQMLEALLLRSECFSGDPGSGTTPTVLYDMCGNEYEPFIKSFPPPFTTIIAGNIAKAIGVDTKASDNGKANQTSVGQFAQSILGPFKDSLTKWQNDIQSAAQKQTVLNQLLSPFGSLGSTCATTTPDITCIPTPSLMWGSPPKDLTAVPPPAGLFSTFTGTGVGNALSSATDDKPYTNLYQLLFNIFAQMWAITPANAVK